MLLERPKVEDMVDRIEASFKNGVLEMRIAKTKETKGKKIAIKVA